MMHVDAQAANPPSATPRLTVIHLLLWMLGCAAAVSGFRIFTNWDQVAAEDLVYLRVLHLGMGMAYGMGAVTLYVWIRSRWQRDGAFPSQPGHWLLVLAVAAALLDGATTLLVRYVVLRWLDPWDEWYVIQWAGWGAGALVALIALLAARMEWRWRLPLVAALVLAASRSCLLFLLWFGYRRGTVYFAWEFAGHVEAVCIALAVLALAAAAVRDVVLRKRRDWLHAAGVAVWLSLATLETANYVRFYLTA